MTPVEEENKIKYMQDTMELESITKYTEYYSKGSRDMRLQYGTCPLRNKEERKNIIYQTVKKLSDNKLFYNNFKEKIDEEIKNAGTVKEKEGVLDFYRELEGNFEIEKDEPIIKGMKKYNDIPRIAYWTTNLGLLIPIITTLICTNAISTSRYIGGLVITYLFSRITSGIGSIVESSIEVKKIDKKQNEINELATSLEQEIREQKYNEQDQNLRRNQVSKQVHAEIEAQKILNDSDNVFKPRIIAYERVKTVNCQKQISI